MANKYSVTKEIFSERLKELMIDNNETTYSIGELLNLSAATISRYRDGKMSPKITTIYSIANHFNVNPVWLMGYDVEKNLNLTDDKVDLSTEEKILIEKFKKLDSEDKVKVIDYTDLLSSQNKYKNKNSKIIDLSKQEKQVWEEPGKEHLMPIACHDDNLTDEEKVIVNKKINEILNNLDKY
ncbi:helix-turn-helix domain-containing protein [Clostridium paraputrificum]|uniref:helix-turn-helix domain-containing protein n=1 Tax=Clostridium paraputrificum TaxID=29363 RepID=UPI00189D4B38|nr:helix-turn-helix transcriptional regulator [Clostridium paraputrificum]MDB2100559.1 helix-turn-helix transcriptional regulator [Clostridium paraputrificum]